MRRQLKQKKKGNRTAAPVLNKLHVRLDKRLLPEAAVLLDTGTVTQRADLTWALIEDRMRWIGLMGLSCSFVHGL